MFPSFAGESERASQFRRWQTTSVGKNNPEPSLPKVLQEKNAVERRVKRMEPPPDLIFTGDLRDGNYWIPVEFAPDEFPNLDFGESTPEYCSTSFPVSVESWLEPTLS
eukprot:547351-Prorocentrum_minimum.AAC.3